MIGRGDWQLRGFKWAGAKVRQAERKRKRESQHTLLYVRIIYSASSFLFPSWISWLCLSFSHTVSDSAEAEMVLILLSKCTVLKSLVHRFLRISHDKSPPAPNSRLHSSKRGLRWKMKYFHFSYLNLSCEHRSVCVWGARDTYPRSLSYSTPVSVYQVFNLASAYCILGPKVWDHNIYFSSFFVLNMFSLQVI